jgi:predicted DNA-binding ArsR family transcriptional regulator
MGYYKILMKARKINMNEGMENLKEIEDLENQPLNRIADALEEILRLVKEDQEKMRKINDRREEE